MPTFHLLSHWGICTCSGAPSGAPWYSLFYSWGGGGVVEEINYIG